MMNGHLISLWVTTLCDAREKKRKRKYQLKHSRK